MKIRQYELKGKCPICNSHLSHEYNYHAVEGHSWKAECTKNECFILQYYRDAFYLKFFNHFAQCWDEEEAQEVYDKQVKYWKENDRYLAEILTRS